MAIAIRDTDPIRGEQADALFDLFYGEVHTTGQIREEQLDATLSRAALEAIERLQTAGR